MELHTALKLEVMYNENSEKVELKISSSRLLKQENINSKKEFLIHLDKESLDRIIYYAGVTKET